MPSEDLLLRVKSRGARATRRDLDQTARSVRGVGSAAKETDRHGRRATGSVRLMSSGFRASVGVFSGAAGALGVLGVAGAARTMVEEFRESRRVGRQTNAVLRSTGGAANVTAKHINRMANSIGAVSGIDDETIQAGENMLLTFRGIRNEAGRGNKVFDRATQTLTDMSVALGVDNRKAAIQLGKALNDPIKGMTALRRVGVTFNDQQTKQVTHLVKTGRTMEAQKLILRELNKEFGGSAKAQADPIQKMQFAWRNLMELLGRQLFPIITKVTTAFAGFVVGIENGTGSGGRFRDEVLRIVGQLRSGAQWLWAHRTAIMAVVGGYVAGLAALRAFMFITTVLRYVRLARGLYLGWRAGVLGMTAAQLGLNIALTANPIGIVIVLVAALAAGLAILIARSKDARAKVAAVWHVLKSVPSIAWGGITTGLDAALNFIIDRVNNLIDVWNALPFHHDTAHVAHVGGGPRVHSGGPKGRGYVPGTYAAPGAATGGVVARGGMLTVGERGPERAFLPTGAVVEPHGGWGGDVIVHSTLVMPDGEVLARQVTRAARKRKSSR